MKQKRKNKIIKRGTVTNKRTKSTVFINQKSAWTPVNQSGERERGLDKWNEPHLSFVTQYAINKRTYISQACLRISHTFDRTS